MSEIICRNCQTANQADNKFCTKCGSRLKSATHLVCPSCYHRNGLNRLHCENCGTRLIGTAPLNIEGPDGTRQTVAAADAEARERESLEWLLSGQAVDIDDEKQVTDWLTQIKDSKPFTPLASEPSNPFAQDEMEQDDELALPDWLKDTAVSPPSLPPASPAEENLPAWLADSVAQSRQPTEQQKPDTDWLSTLGAEPAPPTPKPSPPASPTNATHDDWLTGSTLSFDADELDVEFGFDLDEFATEEEPPASTGFTKWLTPSTVDAFEAHSPSPSATPEEADEPDEFADLFATTDENDFDFGLNFDAAIEAEGGDADADAGNEGEVDFFAQLGLDQPDDDFSELSPSMDFPSWRTETPTTADEPDPDEGEEVPDWLKPSPAEATPPPLSDNPSLTNWLEADESQTETAEDLPDWLRDPTPVTAEDEGDTAVGTGFTAWLREDDGDEPEPTSPTPDKAADLPDWLQEPDLDAPEADIAPPTGFTGLFETAEEDALFSTGTVDTGLGDDQDDDDDDEGLIPDWLKATDALPPEEDVSTGFTSFMTERESEPEQDAPSAPVSASAEQDIDLPAWLMDDTAVGDDTPRATDSPTNEADISTGFTSWLTALEPTLDDDEETPAKPDDDSDLPDWLRTDTPATHTSLRGEEEGEDGTGFTDWLLESGGESSADSFDDLFDDDDEAATLDLTPLSAEEAAQFLADMPEVSEDFIEESVEEDFPDWLVDVETIQPDTSALKLPAWIQEPVSGTDELELGLGKGQESPTEENELDQLFEPADTPPSGDWLAGLGESSSVGAASGLSWLDEEDDDDEAGILSDFSDFSLETETVSGVEDNAAEEDDWLADIEKPDLPQTDWLGRISAEADQASNRMAWLGLDDDEVEPDAEMADLPDELLRPQTDDLTAREMPAWLAAGPADDLGFELFGSDEEETPELDVFGDLSAPTAVGSDDWFANFPTSETDSDSEELPSDLGWLSDMPSADSPDDGSDEEDDWLRDLKTPGGPAVTSQLSWFDDDEEEGVEEEMDTAVSDLPEPEPIELEPSEPTIFDASVDIGSLLGTYESEEEDSPGAEGEDGFDWLAALEESAESDAASVTVEAEASPDIEPADAFDVEIESDQEVEPAEEIEDDALWLASDTAVEMPSFDEEADEIFAMLSESRTSDNEPSVTGESTAEDWLLPPAEADGTSDESWDAWQEEFDENIVGEGEIPAWIDDLDGFGDLDDEEEEEPTQVGGPLDGLKGVIAVAPIVAEPITRVNPLQASQLSISPAQKEQVNLWQAIAQAEFTPTKSEPAALDVPTVSKLPRIGQLALTLLLLAAVLLGLLLPNLAATLGVAPAPPSAQITAVHDTLATASGQPVLVAFDYPPALAGELDETAVQLLSQLAANGSPAILMSQHPAGMAHAERLLRTVPELATLEVARLGYVPGDGVGLRSVSACIAQARCQTMFGRDLNRLGLGLENTAVFILLTSEQDNLINWLEQMGQPTNKPLLLGVTESLAPLARPYAQTGQVAGLLVGLPDTASYAAAYEVTADNTAVSLLEARTWAQLLAILTLLLGLGWGLVPRRTATRSEIEKPAEATEGKTEIL